MAPAGVLMLLNTDPTFDSRFRRIAASLGRNGFSVHAATPVNLPLRATEGVIPLAVLQPVAVSQVATERWLPFEKTSAGKNRLARLRSALGTAPIQVIHLNDLELLPLAFALARPSRARVIFDLREYYSDQFPLAGFPGFSFLRQIVRNAVFRSLEERYLPQCRALFTVVEAVASLYRERIASLPPIEVIFNKFPGHDYVADAYFREHFQVGAHPLLVFPGVLFRSRGLFEIVAAVSLLPEVRLLFLGDGPDRGALEETVRQKNLSNRVYFHPFVEDQSIYLHRLSGTDAVFSTVLPHSRNARIALSNKFWAAAMARVPILAGGSEVEAALVEKLDIGLRIDLTSPARMAEKITELTNPSPLRERFHKNLENLAGEFSWENEEKKLLEVYRKVTV